MRFFMLARPPFLALSFALLLSVFALSACSGLPQGEARYPTGTDRVATGGDIYAKPEGIFGKGGILGADKERDRDDRGADGVTVNSYLWKASLDTVSFMPLASADPFGGVILTDWFVDPNTPNERAKLNVFVLGRELKADGIKVRAFRQVKKGSNWVDASVAAGTETKLEDAILTRARQLRIADQED
jgi:hypothetical protein